MKDNLHDLVEKKHSCEQDNLRILAELGLF